MTRGEELALAGIAQGTGAPDGGVPGGAVLLQLCDAIGAGEGLSAARDAVAAELGAAAVADAVGVDSVFQMMNRIANATGAPLDDMVDGSSADLRRELGIDDYRSNPTHDAT